MNLTEKFNQLTPETALSFNGDIVSITEVVPKGVQNYICASDVDHTAFTNDTGHLAFINILSKPDFWDLTVEKFKKLLLPKEYRKLFEKAENGGIDGITPTEAASMLSLCETITALYEEKQTQLRNLNGNKADFNIQKNIYINEFARQMLYWDKRFLSLEKPLVTHSENNDLLLRARFFIGKTVEYIKSLAKEVMDGTWTSESELLLTDYHHPEKEVLAPKFKLREDIQIIQLSTRIAVNEPVLAILNTAKDNGARVDFISTQVHPLVKHAIRITPELNELQTSISGTKLRANGLNGNSTLGPFSYAALWGPAKRTHAERLEQEYGLPVLLSLGDSTGDLDMIKLAMENQGVGVFSSECEQTLANTLKLGDRVLDSEQISADKLFIVKTQGSL